MLVAGGSTNVTTYFAMRLAADGTGATGLPITNFDLQYVRSGAAPSAKVDATALAATDSAHGDNQAIEIDATDAPGLYRIDWPDAAFAAGVREVILTAKISTCFTEHLRCEIDGEVNVVEWAGTDVVAGAIPAVAADGVGGLIISDAGGLDADVMAASVAAIEADTNELQTDWANGGRLDLLLDAIPTTAMRGTDSAALASVCTEARLSELDEATAGKMANQVDEIRNDTGEIGTAGAGLTNVNLPNQTMDIVGNITGNLSGSVGSVTGAVGSVTGAVGSVVGNVDGSVASVTADVNADVVKISTSATAADNLKASALGIILGTAQTGTLSTVVMTTDLTGYLDDELIGRTVVWTGGTAAGQASDVTDYAAASGTVTYTAITTAPVNGDTFVIV